MQRPAHCMHRSWVEPREQLHLLQRRRLLRTPRFPSFPVRHLSDPERCDSHLQLTNVEVPSSLGRDEYDLRQSNDTDNPFPPKYYSSFLNDSAVLRTIGAEVPYYFECSDAVGAQFNRTGDDARSLLSELGALADTGMKILIWVCIAC